MICVRRRAFLLRGMLRKGMCKRGWARIGHERFENDLPIFFCSFHYNRKTRKSFLMPEISRKVTLKSSFLTGNINFTPVFYRLKKYFTHARQNIGISLEGIWPSNETGRCKFKTNQVLAKFIGCLIIVCCIRNFCHNQAYQRTCAWKML